MKFSNFERGNVNDILIKVASNRILVVTHKFLGSPRGKHCNSLAGNVWRTFVPTSKKTILARDFRFFVALLSEMDLDNADTREA